MKYQVSHHTPGELPDDPESVSSYENASEAMSDYMERVMEICREVGHEEFGRGYTSRANIETETAALEKDGYVQFLAAGIIIEVEKL